MAMEKRSKEMNYLYYMIESLMISQIIDFYFHIDYMLFLPSFAAPFFIIGLIISMREINKERHQHEKQTYTL